ncbi:MAG: hypothetical protein CJBNEKGG_00113 [Prosthecobacter sp.]|nr:hypothetical protein [Prosthecobacter sp.]
MHREAAFQTAEIQLHPKPCPVTVKAMSLRQPLLLVLACLTCAASLPAQSGEEVRPALELAYARWRSAVEARDAKDWASSITMHRQVITRNMVISQGLAFPKSVFDTMLAPAETRGLRLLEAQAVGDTAHLLYFGKVNMGDAPDVIPENLLMLKFFRENGAWKFDSSKLIQLSTQPERRAKLLAGEPPDFLDLPEFTPPGKAPAPPPLAPVPDHITGCTLQSIGYETTLIVNGQEHFVNDSIIRLFLTGGLRNGGNSIQLKVKRLDVPKEVEPVLVVDMFTKPEARGEKGNRVFHYEYKGSQAPSADKTAWTLSMPAAQEMNIVDK